MTESEVKWMERAARDARREYEAEMAKTAKEREIAERAERARKAGITTLKPIEYKGEQLEQITDGAAPYIVYRRCAVVPFFVYRDDGKLICTCAFKKAALGVLEELTALAAAAVKREVA